MLVLTRKRHEEIIIDGRISVFVVEIKGNQVKLGITCPREIPVVRAELSESVPVATNRRQPPQCV